MSVPETELALLFADIAGSTRLYEVHGDSAARDTVAAGIVLMTGVAQRHGGRLVKTIGDEVMCVFRSAAQAVMAGTDMQSAVRTAGEEGRFMTGPLRIRVGLHHGRGIEDPDEVYGEVRLTAAALVKAAKADQVLTSGETLAAVPAELRGGARFLDRIDVEGRSTPVEVFELIWDVSGLTQVAGPVASAARATHARLTLRYRDAVLVVDANRSSAGLGRVEGNDIVVPTDLTSRRHAQVEYHRGRFHIEDMSSNGTVVIDQAGGVMRLRRERVPLEGSGRICLGGTPEENPAGIVEYECE